MLPRLRSINRDPRFLDQVAELLPDIRHADEALRAVEWAIARNPEVFPRVVGNVHVVETVALLTDEDYVFIYFTIDSEDACTLRWIVRGSQVAEEGTLAPLIP